MIGGWDTRPRLGGLVQHQELGVGTIVKVHSKSKVLVFFHGRKAAKLCPLGLLKPVSMPVPLPFVIVLLPFVIVPLRHVIVPLPFVIVPLPQ